MFNWWTFFFQVANFFIVLYILYRLFFNPLRRIIQTREEMIKARLQKLEEREKEVKENEERYLGQMEEIQKLREKELVEARKMALIEKDLLVKETEREIAKAFEKEKRIIDQQREESEKEIRRKSLEFSLHYSEKLLRELSDEQLHLKRIDQFLLALPDSDANEIMQLKEALAGKRCEIVLHTPFELHHDMLQKIKEAIADLVQCDEVALQSVREPALIAGIRLVISNMVLDASVKGELERFRAQMEKEL